MTQAAPRTLLLQSGDWVSRVLLPDPSRVHHLVDTRGAEMTGALVRGDHIFFALDSGGGGSIRRADLDGSHVTMLVRHLDFPEAIAIAGRHLYWIDDNAIGRVRLDGSQVQRRFVVPPRESGGGVGEGLATDGTHLFFSRCMSDSIGRVDLDGSHLNTRFIRSRKKSCPQGLAADAHHLYWAELLYRQENGYIGRSRFDGSQVTPGWLSIRTSEGPFELAAGGEHVYWTWGGSPRGAPTWIARARDDGSHFDRRFVQGSGGISLH